MRNILREIVSARRLYHYSIGKENPIIGIAWGISTGDVSATIEKHYNLCAPFPLIVITPIIEEDLKGENRLLEV